MIMGSHKKKGKIFCRMKCDSCSYLFHIFFNTNINVKLNESRMCVIVKNDIRLNLLYILRKEKNRIKIRGFKQYSIEKNLKRNND